MRRLNLRVHKFEWINDDPFGVCGPTVAHHDIRNPNPLPLECQVHDKVELLVDRQARVHDPLVCPIDLYAHCRLSKVQDDPHLVADPRLFVGIHLGLHAQGVEIIRDANSLSLRIL